MRTSCWLMLALLLLLMVIDPIQPSNWNNYTTGSLISGSRHKRQSLLGSRPRPSDDPEYNMSPPEVIAHRGYQVEVHHAVTPDGYILELHRIKPKIRPPPGRSSKAVYFHHGLLATSGRFVRPPSDRALVFMLADRGYDVWLGNSRGNTYSRRHVHLDPEELPYWEFSWDEMGHQDIPASFNYVMRVTGQKKLVFICLSFGCTLFFIAAATYPSINQNVDVVFALAPSTRVANMRQPIFDFYIVPFYEPIRFYYKMKKTRAYGDFNAPGPLMNAVHYLCQRGLIRPKSCAKMEKRLDSMKTSLVGLVPGADRHFPTGTSIMSMTQFVQNIRRGSFHAYDHGPEGNMARYGSPEPLEYDMGRVTAPLFMFWSKTDIYATEPDIKWLEERLGNVQGSYVVPDSYGHFDFITAENVNEMINYPVIARMPPPFI